MHDPVITFGEVRRFCSQIDLVSVCMIETLCYENFRTIREVPSSYDSKYLYGFGMIESEFSADGALEFRPCLELMLSETPRSDL